MEHARTTMANVWLLYLLRRMKRAEVLSNWYDSRKRIVAVNYGSLLALEKDRLSDA